MKIEKLRNNHKKEIIIGTILTVVIGGALTFRLTHSKYRVTQSIDLGSGVINYTAPDFKIMAMYQQKDGSACTDDSCYNELTGRMPSTGYVINESKSYCNLNGNKDTSAVLKTIDGNHVISNLIKGDKCYLYFDVKKTTVDDIIATNTPKTTTPDFSKTATTDEGVYSTSDGMYGNTTYYWRGAATTNHVIFANKCWRIVRINGDKTMRLIYNGTPTSGTCADFGSGAVVYSSTTSDRYYATSDGQYNNASYVGWTYSLGSQRTQGGTASNAKTQTENWYSSNITGTNATKVADGKYCNDRDMKSGSSFPNGGTGSTTQYYAGYGRLIDNKTPTFNCPSGDVYTLKVGAITANEVAFAGGVYGQTNESYYLKGDNHYWTMSPQLWSGTHARVFFVNSNGKLDYWDVGSPVGLRPAINLRFDVTFSSGDGTISKPYVVSQI